ncbi:gluconate 2-dehydrogenase subunit 3 family protein [Rhodopseudomonas sp. B29]|uniref:gluconate 2-dehydrogenase subunit 3 family protein n=1 Tax=Rhodopseudomonas sp. B29 TaxID=95607 RepID=UPI001FCBB25C|nr:gluconate 2-dehydrogenase subunit 3 family protein [Rhodopseudomonas sp. B29]
MTQWSSGKARHEWRDADAAGDPELRGVAIDIASTFLATTAALVAATGLAHARIIKGEMPWEPGGAKPPQPWQPGPWVFFTADEGAMVEAIVDRLIPPDNLGAGGRQAGCAVYIDRQLAGPYGRNEGLYTRPPFMKPMPSQTPQDPETPAMRYRRGLGALADYLRVTFDGRKFGDLSGEQQDTVLHNLESGKIDLKTLNGAQFFNLLLQNTQEGFFADPIYGGNRDMAGWRLIGFPGARYDYRDWVTRHNERYPLPPVGITGRPEWTL